jgi:hypothetical protein
MDHVPPPFLRAIPSPRSFNNLLSHAADANVTSEPSTIKTHRLLDRARGRRHVATVRQ